MSERREDPWEARERRLARYRKDGGSGGSSRRSRRESHGTPSNDEFEAIPPDEAGLANNLNVAGLLGGAALLLASESPATLGDTRTFLTLGGTAVLVLTLAATRRWRTGVTPRSLLHTPSLLIGLLFAWAVLAWIRAPYREFATLDFARLVAGVSAYLLAAFSLRTPRQAAYVVTGLLTIGSLVALYDLAHYGQTQTDRREVLDTVSSLFGTHENAGSFFVLLLPIALSLTLTPLLEDKRRIAGTIAAFIIGAGLLVARTRSAWLGALAAFVVLAVFSARAAFAARHAGTSRDRPFALTAPAALLAAAMLVFLVASGLVPLITSRVRSVQSLQHLLNDSSFEARLEAWGGAARMTAEQPVWGAGLGTYAVQQGRYTHQGAEPQTVLHNRRFGHGNIAHNYYVQWAAETGIVGLTLHVAAVASFLLVVFFALGRIRRPFARALLISCAASVAGAAIDAVGAPSYNFAGVSTIFWLCLGLGTAAIGFGAGEADEKAVTNRWWVWPPSLLLGAASAACVLLFASYLTRQGKREPVGTFQVTFLPMGKVMVGQPIQWVARYMDAQGQEQSTAPGTLWYFSGDPAVQRMRVSLAADGKHPFTILRAVVNASAPGAKEPIQVRARYQDRYGRWYDAISLVSITWPKPSVVTKTKPATRGTEVLRSR